MEDLLNTLTAGLAERAQHYDSSRAWPAESLALYGKLGGWGWGVPQEYGGDEVPATQRLGVYSALARGCMNTALYVTQHESALDLIVNSDNGELKRRVLPRYARGEGLTTIGYAQLTTSHQGGEPALRAHLSGDAITLEGFMPWVTGAGKAESVAAGAVLPDGQQIVALLPFATPGVEVEPPMHLLALDASHTSVVRCHGVRLEREELVAGPLPAVLARRSPIRRLSVSATGIGLLAAITDAITGLEAAQSAAVLPRAGERIASQVEGLRARLAALAAREDAEQEVITALRADVNALLVRLTGVLMTLAKGTGFRQGRPAQRLVREAMFFCVWSAADPIRVGTLERLLDGTDGG